MRVRLYTRGGKELAVGDTAGDVTSRDIFHAMQRGELCVEAVQLDEQPRDPRPTPPETKSPSRQKPGA